MSCVEPLALVGIGLRFPKASTVAQFWSNLLSGVDCVQDVNPRWHASRFTDPGHLDTRGKVRSARGAFLEDPLGFDGPFFSLSPSQAAAMDPQQRLLLEVAHEAFEDAGIKVEHLAGVKNVGLRRQLHL